MKQFVFYALFACIAAKTTEVDVAITDLGEWSTGTKSFLTAIADVTASPQNNAMMHWTVQTKKEAVASTATLAFGKIAAVVSGSEATLFAVPTTAPLPQEGNLLISTQRRGEPVVHVVKKATEMKTMLQSLLTKITTAENFDNTSQEASTKPSSYESAAGIAGAGAGVLMGVSVGAYTWWMGGLARSSAGVTEEAAAVDAVSSSSTIVLPPAPKRKPRDHGATSVSLSMF